MQKWRLKLDFEHDMVIVDPKVAKFILKEINATSKEIQPVMEFYKII